MFSGKIMLGGASVIDCVVRDLSASGARLKVDEVALVPASFDLFIAVVDAGKPKRCRVVWRRPEAIGVVFE